MQPSDRMDSIQLMRALAALVVVTHHIALFGNGMWGVDLFFIISGFIMCHVTASSRDHFFTKRIIRIVPLYWAGTLAIFTVALVMPSLLNNTTANYVQLFKSLAFIPFQKGPHIHPLLPVGWSLNFEMFFYLLFAISMAISHRYRALICSAMLAAVVLAGRVIELDSVIFRFFTDAIILEFAFGMMAYSLLTRVKLFSSPGSSPLLRLIFVLAGLVAFLTMPLTFPLVTEWERGLVWGIPAVITFVFLFLGLRNLQLPRPVTLIGDASYSLYLFHPFVIQIFDKIFHAFVTPSLQAYLMAALAIGLCCGFAILCYLLVERPVTEKLRMIFIQPNRNKSNTDLSAVQAESQR